MSAAQQHRTRAVGAILLLTVALAGCSRGGDDASDPVAAVSSSDARPPDAGSGAGSTEEGKAAQEAVGRTGSAGAFAGQKVARTAEVSLSVPSVLDAAAKVRRTALTFKGSVVSEQLRVQISDPQAHTQHSIVTISVPSPQLDAALDQLTTIGEVQSRNSSSEDVTSAYIDTDARLATMTASVARVRDLMGRSTSVSDLTQLESELAMRQGELDSLKAQLAHQSESVALSPVTVTLTTRETEAVATTGGFVDGLRSGWSGAAATLKIVGLVLGTLLPFALIAGAVAGPVWWWWRRRTPAVTNS